MTWFAVLVAILGGGMVYKLTSSGKIVTLQNLEGHHSRIKNNPIGSDVARQAVTDLYRSGHPGEIAMRSNYKTKSLREIQGHTANDLQKNASILASDHFNNAKRKSHDCYKSRIIVIGIFLQEVVNTIIEYRSSAVNTRAGL